MCRLLALVAAAAVAYTPLGIATVLLLAGCAGVALYHSRRLGLMAAALILALFAAWLGFAAPLVTPLAHAGAAAASTAPGLGEIGAFFFRVGALTFGGGLTMLAFVQDQVVNQLHWLTPREYLDGLALGQLTPGPILMLAAYVGFKAQGLAGAAVGALAIFLPSFILMLSVLPVLARVRHLQWLKAAMRGISAGAIGAVGCALLQMAPSAAPDPFALALLALTVTLILAWRTGPLPLMLGGAFIGASSRLNPLRQLREML